MFVRKITRIKYVGKFRDSTIRCLEYKKYTLMYGGNGRGKSTVCAILRSLQANDPSYITKRRTFAATAPQEVQVLLANGAVTFNGTRWAAHHPEMHIFDQQFILENVHTGTEVGVDQRRNFYRVVIGPVGVALAAAVELHDSEASAAQTAINADKRVLQQHVPKVMPIETWLDIGADPDIATKIEEAKATVSAAENAVEIATRSTLVEITIPTLPNNFAATLAKGLPELAAEAAERVRAQMAKHDFHGGGEAWLATGLKHITDDDCPFCGNSLAGSALIEAYQGFFSEAYKAHVKRIEDALTDLTDALGPTAAVKVTQGVATGTAAAEFWLRYCPHGVVIPTVANNAADALSALYNAAKAQLHLKASAPLEDPLTSPEYNAALGAWQAIAGSLATINASITPANVLIQGVKKASASSTLVSAQTNLAYLMTVQKRHAPEIVVLVKSYWQKLEAKAVATTAKDAKKAELDLYDAAVLGGYEADINAYLTTFNAPFSLAKCGKTYQGRLPQSAFCLQFDGHDVDVATNSAASEPTFNTTLSAGDKSTFALAFFLAQLKRDPDIAQKVIVFDDPFTSLDDFRREMTAKAIFRVGVTASQVIVFSHDMHFLNSVRTKIHTATDCVALQVSITGGSAGIEDWDIEHEVKDGYLQEHSAMCDYANGVTSDASIMRTKMRPLLEKYIRHRFPNQIQPNHWLGQMLQVIRDTPNHPLKGIYQELDDINEYTAPFHHEPSTSYNDQEVMAHVKRTLVIVGGWSS